MSLQRPSRKEPALSVIAIIEKRVPLVYGFGRNEQPIRARHWPITNQSTSARQRCRLYCPIKACYWPAVSGVSLNKSVLLQWPAVSVINLTEQNFSAYYYGRTSVVSYLGAIIKNSHWPAVLAIPAT